MPTLALDGAGDLLLDASKRLAVVRNADEVAVALRARFRLIRGEWFLDTQQGLPWIGAILGVKKPDMRIVRQILTDVIINTPGVATLDELTAVLDAETRNLAVTFIVTATDGGTITATALDQPFIVKAV